MSTHHLGVVVGIDHSADNVHAQDYAAAEAGRRHLPLTLLHGWQLYPAMSFGPPVMAMPTPDGPIRDAAEHLVSAAAERISALHPHLQVQQLVLERDTTNALVAASLDAHLLVAGRHQGMSIWLGPVLGGVTAHAHCPVVVVPAFSSAEPGPVVVGIDGTKVSAEAVGFAFDQASRWGQPLVAVLAVDGMLDSMLPVGSGVDELAGSAHRYLAEGLAGWSEKYPGVEVKRVVRLLNPLEALRQAARDAALVVVGSHGRGPLRRLALGSVSSSLLRAAPCPMVIVRPEPDLEPEATPADAVAGD